jgi:hypothetical protein
MALTRSAVARILSNLDVEAVWKAAEDRERRVLVEELAEWVTVFPDHLEVSAAGTPPLNVLLEEVGLKGSDCWCRRPDVHNSTGGLNNGRSRVRFVPGRQPSCQLILRFTCISTAFVSA